MGWVTDAGADETPLQPTKGSTCKHRELEFMMWEPYYRYNRRTGRVDYSFAADLKQVSCVRCGRVWDDGDDDWVRLREMFYNKVA